MAIKIFKKKEKELYWSPREIDKTNAIYRAVIGQRSNRQNVWNNEKSCCQPASAVLIYTLSRGSAEIGRQARLRILCPIGRVGSSPISRRNEPEAVELPVFLCPGPYIAQHVDHHGREGFMAEMIL